MAAEAALNGDQGCITPMLDAFKTRHRYVVDALNAIPGFHCVDSGGAFYAFPDVRPAIMNLLARDIIEEPTDIAFSEYLLESADVAVVPGSAFGAEGYIRLSFATSQANLEKAIKRIAAALA
jgi:aspartate aminotransferase